MLDGVVQSGVAQTDPDLIPFVAVMCGSLRSIAGLRSGAKQRSDNGIQEVR